jgi:exonuclease SbcC
MALASATAEAEHAIEAMANAERARQELERAQEVHARLDRERLFHDELIRAYTDLRTELNYRMRPDLSDLASDYLGELTDGRYDELQIDDHYNITVVEAGIPKQVISGGEEDLLNLAVRLAISQMIAERSGQAFSLLVLDEVFGSLDEHRRLRVVELLRRLLDRFEQIIVMTHIEGTRDDLDHKVRIDYDDRTGESRVWSVDAAPMSIDDLGADLLAAGAES